MLPTGQGVCLNADKLERIERGQNRLVLYPLNPDYKLLEPGRFARWLQSIGFIRNVEANQIETGEMGPGEHFMRLLTFVGCSPAVGSGNQENAYNNYSVEIVSSAENKILISGNRVRSPFCPKCGVHKKEMLAAETIRLQENKPVWACPECGVLVPIENINWRKKLAVASHYITVNGVFEGEVIPADKFLDDLGRETGIAWSYCYC